MRKDAARISTRLSPMLVRPSEAVANALAALPKGRPGQMATSPRRDPGKRSVVPPPPLPVRSATSSTSSGSQQRSASPPRQAGGEGEGGREMEGRERSASGSTAFCAETRNGARAPPLPPRDSPQPRSQRQSCSRTPPHSKRSRSRTPPHARTRSRSRTPPRSKRSRSRTPPTQHEIKETDTIWVSGFCHIHGDTSKMADAENMLRATFNRFGKISCVSVHER
jgi:hypothetical protein